MLSDCPVLILLDVYPAGEAPIAGADSRALTRSIRQRGAVEPIFVASSEQLPAVLKRVLRDGDLLLTQGAGNIAKIAQQLAAADRLEDLL